MWKVHLPPNPHYSCNLVYIFKTRWNSTHPVIYDLRGSLYILVMAWVNAKVNHIDNMQIYPGSRFLHDIQNAIEDKISSNSYTILVSKNTRNSCTRIHVWYLEASIPTMVVSNFNMQSHMATSMMPPSVLAKPWPCRVAVSTTLSRVCLR